MQSSDNNWHHLAAESVLNQFASDSKQGLSQTQVARYQQQYGLNQLARTPAKSRWRLLISQFNQPLIYILLASAIITACLQEWLDASVIFGVVIVNAAIGFSQEAGALKAISALSRHLNQTATVLRDGQKQIINAAALVPGDLVFLQSGDKVPADLRLLQSSNLQIDESTLTGESLAVAKQTAPLAINTLLAERNNMAFSSTLVNFGSGLGIVVATGDQTEIGLISRLLRRIETLETPLTQKLDQFSTRLLWIIIALAGITFAVGLWRGEPMLDMFMAAVALAVGAIPEGLPAAMTITLAIGVSRMAKRNAIIRKLPAVETLGSTTVICSDKTGTLTQNQMTVQRIYAGGQLFSVDQHGFSVSRAPDQAITPDHYPSLINCLQAGVLCNDARARHSGEQLQYEGDPTETALLLAGFKAGIGQAPLNQQFPRLDTIGFESAHQFMASLHQHDQQQTIYLKGALEAILPRCDSSLNQTGQRVTLDSAVIHKTANQLAAQGLRILAFAQAESPDSRLHPAQLEHGLTFIGLQAMMDPPRPEAIKAISACYQAGISVKMITGDHPLTALAIARQLGMRHTEQVISGADLLDQDPSALPALVKKCAIYARISPEQKLQLVQAMQANGDVVAMTGDGVNDAPALRQANIGIAMGQSGTDVAKEAAAMILTDDHFATIQAAVEEGRGVYDNLVKFIVWTLPTNLGEGLVITTAVLANVALPITALQILWINMTTAVLLGLTLAFEPKETDLMQRKPRHPGQAIFTPLLALRIMLVGILLLAGAFGLFAWELSHQESLAAARTAAVNVFVFGQILYLFNCRSLRHSVLSVGIVSNRWLILGVVTMTLLQLLFSYWSPMQQLFGTSAIGLNEWLLIGMVSLLIYGVIGLEKLLCRRLLKS